MVDLGADTTDLVPYVVAVQVAASALYFVSVFKFSGFIVEFVNGRLDLCWLL